MLGESFRNRIREILRGRPEIRFAVLFGSAAEREQFDDVDLAILLDDTGSLFGGWEVAFDLQEALERALPYPIVNDASLAFRYKASRGVPLLLNDPAAWYTFREETWVRYWDFQPVALQFLKEMR